MTQTYGVTPRFPVSLASHGLKCLLSCWKEPLTDQMRDTPSTGLLRVCVAATLPDTVSRETALAGSNGDQHNVHCSVDAAVSSAFLR